MKTKLQVLILLCTICALSVNAQTTQLWGTAYSGGATGQGTIFKADATGNNFQIAYSFVNATGAMPNGGLVLANNGKLYGVTELGGFGDSCVVYSYEPSTGTFTDIHDLYQYTLLGWEAKSVMMKASDGSLYGLCAAGGANYRAIAAAWTGEGGRGHVCARRSLFSFQTCGLTGEKL